MKSSRFERFLNNFRSGHGNERHDEQSQEDEIVEQSELEEPVDSRAWANPGASAPEEEDSTEPSREPEDEKAMQELQATVASEEARRERAREKARFARAKAAEEAPAPKPITQQQKQSRPNAPVTPDGGLTPEERERRIEALRRTHGSDDQKAA